jgi:hypothetical protein
MLGAQATAYPGKFTGNSSLLRPSQLAIAYTNSPLFRGLVSSLDRKMEEGKGLGTLAKFLGYADIAFLIPELPIRRARWSCHMTGHTALASTQPFVATMVAVLQQTSLLPPELPQSFEYECRNFNFTILNHGD